MLLGILLVTIVLAILSQIEDGLYNDFFFVVAVSVLVLFCGMRDPFLYPDMGNYYDYFVGDVGDLDENFGLGYSILTYSFNLLTGSFFLFLLVISTFTITSYTIFIKKYSPYIWLSLLLYLFINYYPSFFLLRQYLAMAVFLFSIKYIICRDALKFGIISIVAISLHLSAVVVVPLYFLYGLSLTTKNMILLAFGSLLSILFFMKFADIVNLFSAYYALYFESENESVAWQRALMKIYIAILYVYVVGRNCYNEGINRVVFYANLLNVIICVAAMNMNGVFRLREYFAFADFIGVPIIIEEITYQNKWKQFLLYGMVFIYILLLFVAFCSFIFSDNMNNDYRFFWSGEDYWMLK
jgi:hypothetical protein